MYEYTNCPVGSDTPDAPWNQPDIPPKEFSVTVSQTLSKTTTITTTDYNPICTEDGFYEDTSNTNWEKAYLDSSFTIQDLLIILKGFIKGEMTHVSPNSGTGRYLTRLLEACKGWIVDDYSVINND